MFYLKLKEIVADRSEVGGITKKADSVHQQECNLKWEQANMFVNHELFEIQWRKEKEKNRQPMSQLTITTGQISFVIIDCAVNLSLSSTVIGRDNAKSKLLLLVKKMTKEWKESKTHVNLDHFFFAPT